MAADIDIEFATLLNKGKLNVVILFVTVIFNVPFDVDDVEYAVEFISLKILTTLPDIGPIFIKLGKLIVSAENALIIQAPHVVKDGNVRFVIDDEIILK